MTLSNENNKPNLEIIFIGRLLYLINISQKKFIFFEKLHCDLPNCLFFLSYKIFLYLKPCVIIINDIVGLNDLYLNFSISKSTINMVRDVIASGDEISGTSFVRDYYTSSYSNGNFIRS